MFVPAGSTHREMATIPITEDSIVISARTKHDLARIKPAYGCQSATLDQSQFLHTLCRERKRSERSGRSLLLLLFSAARTPKEDRIRLLDLVHRVISASIRETDVLGCYEKDITLAVLFTEIGVGTENVSLIVSKLKAALEASLCETQLESLDISFRVFPDGDTGSEHTNYSNLEFYPDSRGHINSRKASRVLKRCIDVVGSSISLVLFLPIFMIVAILIKLTSPGPVLFRQERIGQNGKSFIFLKFRSMYKNNDSTIHEEYVARLIQGKAKRSNSGDGSGVYKLTDDPRVTPLGKFLRRTSLDELPQLLNVLRGEMSLVGPRPSVAYEYQRYSPWHRRRVLAKPGITGLWQVLGRSKTTFDDMVRLDLTYANRWSIWMDLKILVNTPLAVVRGDGAY